MSSTIELTEVSEAVEKEAIQKLRRDVRAAAATLSDREARYLVDAYYTIQQHRIEAQNQVRALAGANIVDVDDPDAADAELEQEPHVVLSWLFEQHVILEKELVKSLGTYADGHTAGIWARTITGIGPVIAAGLLAHIDIEKAPTVGHIWRFAGLDPTVTWGKGEKRPWNASLKVLCWKIGESFVKVSGRDSDVYGKVYLERKQLEQQRNEAGLFADQAAATLEAKRIGKDTQARGWYEKGMLPPARIHARSKRYAVKLFLSHYHHVAYVDRFGEQPPKPYIIEHGGHTHFVAPPNWPLPAE